MSNNIHLKKSTSLNNQLDFANWLQSTIVDSFYVLDFFVGLKTLSEMNSGTAGWYSLIQWPSKISNVAGLKFTISKQEIYFLVLSWCSFQHAMLVYQSIQKITMTSKKKKEWRHKPLHIYTSDMLLFQCFLRGVWYIVIISSIDNTTFNPEFGMIWAISRTVLWRSLRWTMFVQTSSLRCQTFSMWEWPNFVESNDMMIRRLKKKEWHFFAATNISIKPVETSITTPEV